MDADKLEIITFKHSKESFLSLLAESNIPYARRPHAPGVIMAAGEAVEILKAIGAVSIFPSLAAIIVQWLKVRSSRKIILQTKDMKVVHLEGYSANEISRLLEQSQNITVIDTKPNDPSGTLKGND